MENLDALIVGEGCKGRYDESDQYLLSLPNEKRSQMAEIFEKLDSEEAAPFYNIRSYNVRVTSLEEVFNASREEEEANDENEGKDDN